MPLGVNDAVNRRELTYKALAGLVGGALGWLPVEIVSFGHSITEQESSWYGIATVVAMALLSGLIGGLIVASDAQSLELTPLTKRRFIRGFLICLVAAYPATLFGNRIFTWFLVSGGWAVNQPGSIVF